MNTPVCFKKYDLIMDEDIAIINEKTRNEKIKNFLKNKKKKNNYINFNCYYKSNKFLWLW